MTVVRTANDRAPFGLENPHSYSVGDAGCNVSSSSASIALRGGGSRSELTRSMRYRPSSWGAAGMRVAFMARQAPVPVQARAQVRSAATIGAVQQTTSLILELRAFRQHGGRFRTP